VRPGSSNTCTGSRRAATPAPGWDAASGPHRRGQCGSQLHDRAGQGLAAELDALAGEGLPRAVQWQAVDELARDRIGAADCASGPGQGLRRAGRDAQTRMRARHIGVDRGVPRALDPDHAVLLG